MSTFSLADLATFIHADWRGAPDLPESAEPAQAGAVNLPGQHADASNFAPYIPLGSDADQISVASDHHRFKRVHVRSATACSPFLLIQFAWPSVDDSQTYLWLADMRDVVIDDLLLISAVMWGNLLQKLSITDWPTSETVQIFSEVRLLLP